MSEKPRKVPFISAGIWRKTAISASFRALKLVSNIPAVRAGKKPRQSSALKFTALEQCDKTAVNW